MTLTSNVKSQEDHGDQHRNRIGNFVTRLPSKPELDGDWVVGLCEIQYTNSWYNLKKINTVSLVKFNDKESNVAQPYFLPPGRYTELKPVLREVSGTSSAKCVTCPKLDYNPFSHRVIMRMGKGETPTDKSYDVMFHYSEELSQLLGLYDGQVYGMDKDGEYLEGASPYDLTGGINNLYIYSDVVDYSTVGDVKAQLLRTVKIPNEIKFGDAVDITYEKPYYIPVASREIGTIEIDIKDDSGEPINFMFGRVQVILHFVKIK